MPPEEEKKPEPMPENEQLRHQVKLVLNDEDDARLLAAAGGKKYRRGDVVRLALQEFFEGHPATWEIGDPTRFDVP